ncbi:MAG: SDR family oxidoreductase [Acidobacteria bacterium]|nr:SDR family oxidoreductase [Acidobacteriota bacterium]
MAGAYHLLVFGASGALGSAICEMALTKGWRVTGVARSIPAKPPHGARMLALDPLSSEFSISSLASDGGYDAVCWAQGANATDNVYNVDAEHHMQMYNANCLYVLATLKALLAEELLLKPARLCVISSIWQQLARQNKLSYCMTKAAVEGLVLSASADLAKDGHLINAVLPGAVDTPMTRKALKAEQIDAIAKGTQFDRLTSLDDVASIVCYLCSPENTGVTGQFVAADLGWSRVRIV